MLSLLVLLFIVRITTIGIIVKQHLIIQSFSGTLSANMMIIYLIINMKDNC